MEFIFGMLFVLWLAFVILRWGNSLLELFPKEEIWGEGGIYLTRYTLLHLGRRFVRLKLHRFHRADEDPEPHNHPWQFGLSLILKGGYTEEVWDPTTASFRVLTHMPGEFNFIRHQTYHRVTHLHAEEVWTLFLTGPLVSSWGFLDLKTKMHVPWKQFIKAKGLTPNDEVEDARREGPAEAQDADG